MKPATTAAMTRLHGTITHAIFFVYHQSSAATNAGFDRRCSSLTRGRCCAEALAAGDIVNVLTILFFEKCRMNYLYNETNLQNGEGYVGSTNHEPHPNSKEANGAHYRARLATET